jgi:hypothetical protein
MGTENDDPVDAGGRSHAAAVPVPVRPPTFDSGGEGPSESLVAGTMGDRCVSCGAPLAPDQRYCVNCGERRGAARFTLPTPAAAAPEASRPAADRPKRSRRPRASSGATLVAGVGTLLLALGVGVLIGHGAGGQTKTVQGHAQVIKVNEGGGGVATSSGGSAAAASGSSGASKKGRHSDGPSKHKSGGSSKHKATHKAKSAAPPPPKPTRQEAQAAQNAANKVTGGGNVNNAPATVTVGASCTGAGCDPKTHKFNGNFFGGG